MKLKLIILVIYISANIFAQEKHVKIFPFKSAIIEYKYEAGLGGTHVKYIDEYGYKQADYIRKEIKLGNEIEKDYQTIILIGSRAYTANYKDSTIAIGANSTYSYYLNIDKSPLEITEVLIRAEGFELTGTKEFLGKECEYWKAGKAKKLTWNDVELKSTTYFMMMMVEKATSIETDVSIPDSVFDLPKNMNYISSDVYQGYAGLELKFDKSAKSKNEDNNIKVSFSSSSLEDTSQIPFYTQEGEELIQAGDNDYNKVDREIIESQNWQLQSEEIELERFRTLIFIQENAYGDEKMIYGKVQINKVGEEGFSYRYIVFDENNDITGYSDDSNEALTKIFNVSKNKSNHKLIFKPKNKTKCMLLGW